MIGIGTLAEIGAAGATVVGSPVAAAPSRRPVTGSPVSTFDSEIAHHWAKRLPGAGGGERSFRAQCGAAVQPARDGVARRIGRRHPRLPTACRPRRRGAGQLDPAHALGRSALAAGGQRGVPAPGTGSTQEVVDVVTTLSPEQLAVARHWPTGSSRSHHPGTGVARSTRLPRPTFGSPCPSTTRLSPAGGQIPLQPAPADRLRAPGTGTARLAQPDQDPTVPRVPVRALRVVRRRGGADRAVRRERVHRPDGGVPQLDIAAVHRLPRSCAGGWDLPLYGGIHFRPATERGIDQGALIGQVVAELPLRA